MHSSKNWAACLTIAGCLAQSPGEQIYQDPQKRFIFAYPSSFGTPSPGTDNGAGDRIAAIRLARFSAGLENGNLVFGGEAVVTLLDLQAAGGLYDQITLQIFPQRLRATVVGNLPRLTVNNFCGEIAKETHVDLASAAFASLNANQKQILVEVDRMRNIEPQILACEAMADTVVFDKRVAFSAGGPRQHVYGAVRFLSGSYSTFQFIRGGNQPPAGLLEQMAAVVRSWRAQ